MTAPTPPVSDSLPVVGYVPEHQIPGGFPFACLAHRKIVDDDVPLVRLSDAQSTITALEEKCARLEVEAARYRWLRDVSTPGICAFYLSVGKAFEGVKFARETVDEAIDAQIAAMKEQTP